VIASLGMYDFRAAAAANDRLWALIRDDLRGQGIDAPENLTRGEDAYWPAWQSPDLLLSQTCGYPYRARLHGQVTLVGTPDYDLPDVPPGHYYSVFVVRSHDTRRSLTEFDGASFAYNEDLSQSGWAAPQNHAARLGLTLAPTHRSGGHQRSARAVADGIADIAALDAVTWALMQDFDPVARQVRVIAQTDPTPVLPYITARDRDPGPIFAAIATAIAALAPNDRALLRLKGIVAIPAAAYLAVPNPPTPDQIAHSLAPS
jgi:ABC-type phosphate/phosphonate transport system substrate-binding protein